MVETTRRDEQEGITVTTFQEHDQLVVLTVTDEVSTEQVDAAIEHLQRLWEVAASREQPGPSSRMPSSFDPSVGRADALPPASGADDDHGNLVP